MDMQEVILVFSILVLFVIALLGLFLGLAWLTGVLPL